MLCAASEGKLRDQKGEHTLGQMKMRALRCVQRRTGK